MKQNSTHPLDYQPLPPRRRFRLAYKFLLIPVTAACHSCLQLLLYRARSAGNSPFANSDLAVFGLPTLLALTGFYFTLHRRGRPLANAILTLGTTFFSTWVAVMIAFNTYGT